MKKSILKSGKILNKVEQRSINGGRSGCYSYPDASVNCISPWVIIHGCYTCKTAS
ncbi:hypothetical protein [uncultured Tenacibaculum sp.]|uniref:hypothetical protein n=1 Tax=uncultured Tenacibaculum sp. TaxID=174713 RepID=UPI00262A6418|nr:hypothetical protein [uncultured Tenacibaculum sp.]